MTWVLPSEDFALSEPLGLSFDATSDLALPLFEPGDEGTTLMAFDADDRLNIQGYVDDTVVPATADDTRAYYRWYACQTYYSGYVSVFPFPSRRWGFGRRCDVCANCSFVV